MQKEKEQNAYFTRYAPCSRRLSPDSFSPDRPDWLRSARGEFLPYSMPVRIRG